MSNTATYSADVGNHKSTVTKTTGSSGTGSPAVEITIDQGAVALGKDQVVLLIGYITERIIQDTFPEA